MIVVDVETTGLDCKKNSIIEIGAVDFLNPKNRFFTDCRAKPDSEINDYALKINGHTREDIYSFLKSSQKTAIESFDSWLRTVMDITIMGENPRFDLDFLAQAYNDAGMDSPFGHRTIDLHSIAISHILSQKSKSILIKDKRLAVNSEFIMQYVGIPNEPKPHNGLNGAIYEAEAFSRLIFGENLLEEFKKFPVPEYLRR